MSLTIGQINSAVFFGLGQPDASICSMPDVHQAVRNTVMLLTKQMRAGDTNQPLSVSGAFLPTASPFDITSYLSGEKSTIAWLERKEGTRWKVVRVVPKAFLEQYYDADLPAAAIYSDETGKTFIELSVVVASDSTQQYRVWYDKDPVTTTRSTEVLIPDSFEPYPVMLAQNSLIARLRLKLAEQIENDEERKILAVKLEAWDGIVAQNLIDMRDWRPLWKTYLHRNRTAQTQDRLPNKRGSHLYGG